MVRVEDCQPPASSQNRVLVSRTCFGCLLFIRRNHVHCNTRRPQQGPLTAILPIKSPADYNALTVVLPEAAPAIEAALSKTSTVHFARPVFLADNTQMAVITTYDGDFAQYIGDFAREMGGVFDLLSSPTHSPPDQGKRRPSAAFTTPSET